MGFQEPFIVWLQMQLHPACDTFFKSVTFFGGFDGVLILWCFFVWCISYSYGCRLIFLTQFVQYVSSLWIKALVALPRPYQTFPSILPILEEKGYAFPSGHALNGMLYWGYLAWFVKKEWVTFFSVVAIFLIGLSRIYLGVHYPTDVLGGWLIGGIGLWLLVKGIPKLEKYFKKLGPLWKTVWILCLGLVLWAQLVFFGPAGIPMAWQANFIGMYFGISFGWLAKDYWLVFEAEGSWMQKVTRFVLGYLVLYAALHYGPKVIWIHLFSGLWISFGAPALFQILRLNGSQQTEVL